MQHKIRINDLARELEVKSREVLEILSKVGITEKKTHSSSIEEDEAERIKRYFAEQAPSTSRGGARPSAAPDEFKPKIDLSHISKPGDVLKAITQRAAQPAAPARPVAPPVPRPTVAPPSAVPPRPAAPAASTQPAAPVEVAPRFITPQSVARPPAPIVAPPKPPAPPAAPHAHAAKTAEAVETKTAVLDQPEAAEVPEVEAPAQIEAATPAAPVTHLAPPARTAAPPTPAPTEHVRPAQPAPPPRRLIVPQTGPRPVYAAQIRPAVSTPPRNVMPERGKPIFQRPRPGAPPTGAPRPPMRPGERRGPHPTRSGAPGTRPGFAPGSGMAPPPTGQRPMGRPARPGQRYIPRGVKEGPMKGFVPPPRYRRFQRAAADHAEHHDYRRHQREGPGREAGSSRQGPDRHVADARRVRHGEPVARRRDGEGHGAPVRRRHHGHQLRGGDGQDTVPTERRRAKTGELRSSALAGGHRHGPRRSRQDQPARCDSRDERSRRRSWRHYAAHRRVQGRDHRRKARLLLDARSSSSTRRATKRLPACVLAERRSRTSWCSWLRPMTA